MKKTTKTIDLFLASDGREFLTEAESKHYEENVLKRLKNIKYFSITYNPDTTEGRGYYSRIFVAIEASYSHDLIAELFCEQCIGSRVAWVMGVSMMTNWTISKITLEDFNNYKHFSYNVYAGDYGHGVKRLFISNENLEGYPKAFKCPYDYKEKFANYKEYLEF